MVAIKLNFLIFIFLNIIFTCIICSPLNDDEDVALTTKRIEVFTSVSPPKSLCDDSEDTVTCSIYDFLGSIFKVGRSVSTLVSLAQKVLGSEGNGTEHLLGADQDPLDNDNARYRDDISMTISGLQCINWS